MPHTHRSIQRNRLILLFMLAGLLLLPIRPSSAAPSVQVGTGNWYSLHYVLAALAYENFTLTALALDANGNGWVGGLVNSSTAVLIQLQNGRLGSAAYSEPNFNPSAIGLSSDGREGWVVGSTTDETSGVINIIQHYINGRWGLTSVAASGVSPQVAGVLHPQYVMVLDRSAHNGWAVGVDSSHLDQPTLLQLANGKWQDMTSLLPAGVGFTYIAASPDLKYV